MGLNLATSSWLPILQDGAVHRATPLEVLTGDHRALAYGQPDLNAAAVELLVSMAQTAVPAASDKEWRTWMKAGRFPDDLEARWNRLAPAFHVRHEERPFMQDPSLDASKPKRIELLDATRSPDNAVTEGRALFAQPDPDQRLAADEAALRVWMYQTWSPVSSSKLRGSYRGHGPLSTLVRTPTLRGTILANLLPATDADPMDWIGWGGALTTKEQEPYIKHRDPDDPRSALWMTPRRVLLAFDGEHATGFVNGPMRGQLPQTAPHPHSPGRFEKEKWVAGQGRSIGRGYPTLLPLAMEPAKPKSKTTDRALVVKNYLDQRDRLPEASKARLWAYGYHVDNNVDGWNEATVPLVAPDEATRTRIDGVVAASEKILNTLWKACYEVVKDDAPDRDLRPNDKKLPFDAMRDRYHRATEDAFWRIVESEPDLGAATAEWWNAACDSVEGLLAEWVSGFPETRLAGRVRAQAVINGLRRRRNTLLPLEDP